MRIGRVIKEKVECAGVTYTELVMDIRTITTRKKFNINLNKIKYPDGDIKKPKEGYEDFPDYLLWYNINGKGEALPQEHVGNISNAISKDGKEYKKGFFYDPFISTQPIYFSIHPVEKETVEGHIFNVVAHIPLPSIDA